MEQSLYAAEGITIVGIKFVDNQPTLDLLEAKATGIFSMIDEEISVPKGSDESFLQKVFSRHVVEGKHPNCLRPKGKDCKDTSRNFGILHYAGPVFYNISSFLEKNKDQLHVDILSVLRTSSSPLLKRMFPAPVEETNGRLVV
jgi:myosin heavy subunit